MTASLVQYNIFQQLTSAHVVMTSNLSGSYLNGNLNNGVGATLTASMVGSLVIDGVTLLQGERVLLVAQTNSNENGVYFVSNPGGSSAVWILTRSADQQSIEQLKEGQYIPVGAGTTNAGAMYVLISPLPGALGIDDLNFSPTSVPSGSTFLVASNNLSDVSNASTSRSNLGAQSSANIKAATTGNIGGSGAGPLTVTVAGLTASSIVVANIEGSTNPASIISCNSGSGSFDVTLSADPGATCTLNYIAFIAAQ